MADAPEFDVFLSYARADGTHAQALDSWLRARGLKTFFDRSNLAAGGRWIVALEDAIGRSGAVAILIGAHGIGNTQQYERELALVRQSSDSGFPVIPVLLPGCQTPPTGFLQLLTWVDLRAGSAVAEQPEPLLPLLAAIRREPAASAAIRGAICPYVGLEPFREEDAAFFCGRDGAIAELVAQVDAHSFTAVVGRSGSGKSSLIFAGLLPALRRRHTSTVWQAMTLNPGRSPLESLAIAFRTEPLDPDPFVRDEQVAKSLASLRRADPQALARVIARKREQMPEPPDRLLLYIDQWEELYTMGPGAEAAAERQRQQAADVEQFVRLILGASAEPEAGCTVVITVRADFYGPMIRDPALSAVLPRQQVNIGPITREDLRAAIETPAQRAGLRFEPRHLVDQILDDAGADEATLPLLQYALKGMWEQREGAVLTADSYSRAGGVKGAIRLKADQTYAALTAAQQQAARRLFLSLVTPGEGREDTRARITMPDEPGMRAVIERFANPRARLLVTGVETAPAASGQVRATLEVAHEALIRNWPILRGWLDTSREQLRARAAVLAQMREWEAHDRRADLLLQGGFQLERGRQLIEHPGDVPVGDIEGFVRDSIARQDAVLEAARAAELEKERRIAAIEQQARARAEQERDRAMLQESRALAILARQCSEAGDQPTAMLLALEALPEPGFGGTRPRSAEALAVLYLAWLRNRETALAGHRGAVNAVGFSPDGARVVTASDDGTAIVWDLRGPRPVPLVLAGHAGGVTAASFSPDGLHVLTASRDHTARVWTWGGTPPRWVTLAGHTDAVLSAVFSPDGAHVATASADATARLWDWRADPAAVRLLQGHAGAIRSAAFSRDAALLVTASADRTARVWDLSAEPSTAIVLGEHGRGVTSAAFSPDASHVITVSSEPIAKLWDLQATPPAARPLLGPNGVVRAAAFSPAGDRAVTAASDHTARVWDLLSSELTALVLERHADDVRSAVFSPDGTSVATASADRTARVWDLARHPPATLQLHGHAGPVNAAAFSPDGSLLATASIDGTARVWHLHAAPEVCLTLAGHSDGISAAAFSADGSRAVTAAADDTARVWDLTHRDAAPLVLEGHTLWVTAAAFSPDGQRAVTASADGTAMVWDLAGDPPVPVALEGHTAAVLTAAFCPAGQRILTTSGDGTARIWQAGGSGWTFLALHGHADAVTSASFSQDGQRVLTASADGTARVWDLRYDPPRPVVLTGHTGSIHSAAFSPDGARVVTASEDASALLWDLRSDPPVAVPLAGHGTAVRCAAFSPDGTRIVTAAEDHTGLVWDVHDPGRMPLMLEGHSGAVTSAAFSPAGAHILTGSADGTARLWDLRGERPVSVPLEGHSGAVTTAAFSQDGRAVITGSDDFTARVWRLFPDDSELITAVRNRLSRRLSAAQRERFGLSATASTADRHFIPPADDFPV